MLLMRASGAHENTAIRSRTMARKRAERDIKGAGLCAGLCSFEMTKSVEQKIAALSVYMQVSELVSKEPERLTVDGLLNMLLDDITNRYINDLVKKHGFDDAWHFISSAISTPTPNDFYELIQTIEKGRYVDVYRRVLSQIPVPDTQKELAFAGEDHD